MTGSFRAGIIDVTLTDVDDGYFRTVLSGTDGPDVLVHRGGQTEFATGAGRLDRSYGSADSDLFLFGEETNNGVREYELIYNFNPSEDVIALCGAEVENILFENATALFLTLTGDGDSLYIYGHDINFNDIDFI